MPEITHVDLNENALLRSIPPQTLAELGELPRATFEAGDMIFDENADGDTCFLVESGLVRISKGRPDGSHETLGFIGPGEFFGELAALYATPRSARATAVSTTVVGQLEGDVFRRLRNAAPLEITAAVAEAGLRRLRELHGTLIQQVADSDRFKEIGVGISMVAHDIRSPLATIQMAADSVLEFLDSSQPKPELITKHVDIIRRTANSALRTTDQILTRLRGEVAHKRETVPARELALEASAQITGLLRDRPVDFQSELEYEGTIVCERDELVRAVANLLRNAVEALPSEGGRVKLEVRGDENEALFKVSDSGCGIPAEYHGKIFERRFTMGKSGGTGLGLDHVRQVVERHDGRITLESAPGQGSAFTIRMPARSSEVRDAFA